MTGGHGPLCGCVSHACPQARGAAARWAGAAHLRVSRVSAHRHAHAHPRAAQLASAHGAAPRGVYAGAEDRGGAARAAPAGPRGKARSRSLTPRVLATPCQRCLPNRFSETMPFRRWQSHGRGPAKRIGPPGTSWLFPGGQGDTPLPQSQIARRGAGVLPPHPKLGAGNPKLASGGIPSGNKKSRRLRWEGCPHKGHMGQRGRQERDELSQPRGGFLSSCAITLTPSPFPLTRQS